MTVRTYLQPAEDDRDGVTVGAQRFRALPTEVEAIRFTGDNAVDIADFIGYEADDDLGGIEEVVIETADGDMVLCVGDWMVRGVAGEFFACPPDIFDESYEPVDEQ